MLGSGFLWWVGFLVVIVFSRKLIVVLISRHKSLCFWSSSVSDALAPMTTGNKTCFPWIVVNIPKRNAMNRAVVRKIAERWKKNPILLLTAEGENLTKDWMNHDRSDGPHPDRAVEILNIDYSANISTLGDIFRDRFVGLVISCLEPKLAGKAIDLWCSDEIRSEIWSTLRHHAIISRLCLPNMIVRNAGAIVALCSEDPVLNIPNRSIQSAIAQGLMVFAQAMQTECRSKNILVQTWLYNRFQIESPVPVLQDYLRESNGIELFSDRCLSCLETGSTSWIFPLGYTQSVIRPAMRQELLAIIAEFMPSQLLSAIRRSTLPIF